MIQTFYNLYEAYMAKRVISGAYFSQCSSFKDLFPVGPYQVISLITKNFHFPAEFSKFLVSAGKKIECRITRWRQTRVKSESGFVRSAGNLKPKDYSLLWQSANRYSPDFPVFSLENSHANLQKFLFSEF